MSIPLYVDVRNRIEKIDAYDVKMFVKAVYLFGIARPVELASKRDSGSKGRPILGVTGNDAELKQIDQPELDRNRVIAILSEIEKKVITIEQAKDMLSKKAEIAIFRIKKSRIQSKREKALVYRDIALPTLFDPWVKEMYRHFKIAGSDYVFRESRSDYWGYLKQKGVFKGLKHIIPDYTRTKKAISGKASETEIKHEKPVVLEGLRHIRYEELHTEYGFDDLDWGIFTGGQIRIGRNNPIFIEDWHRYINKLLQKPSFKSVSSKQLFDF